MLKRFALLLFVLALGANMVQAQEVELSPAETVEEFYAWYLDFIGTGEDFRNPLVERAYHDNPLLTGEFIAGVDALLERWQAEYGGYVADPFLCAQAVPSSLTVEEARYRADGQAADVVVRTSFPGHAVTVDLVQRDEQWLINHIRCGETRTPEGAVKRFYAWYLDYHRWDGEGERPNALVEQAYHASDLLTVEFVARVDAMLAEMVDGGYDPFLCAQDLPDAVRVVDESQVSGDSARLTVETSFEGHAFDVVLTHTGESWQISDVVCQPAGEK